MYCSNYSTQLDDDPKLCNDCGSSVSNTKLVLTANKEIRSETPYDRDITLLHLYNLRMLEMAETKLIDNWIQANYKIESLCIPKDIKQPHKNAFRADILVAILGFFVIIVFLLGAEWVIDEVASDDIGSFFKNALIVISVITGIFGVIISFVLINKSVSSSRKYRQNMARYHKEIEDDEARIKNETIERDRWISIKEEIHIEKEKARNLLESAYSVNLIPEQYRNLYAVYYLHEYLSASQETLCDALLHWNLHYNFEEAKQKLDAMYQQVCQLVIEQAVTNARLESIQEQNEQMLQHAINTEMNTAKVAQYSQIAATNTETLVYIQSAHYITEHF